MMHIASILIAEEWPPNVHDIDPVLTTFLAVFTSVMASSGFWAWLQKRSDKNDAATQLALGLAHNELVSQGLAYIERGYITKDEYDDYIKYLYAPYAAFGGNGLAERIVSEVRELPVRRAAPLSETPRKYIQSQEAMDEAE